MQVLEGEVRLNDACGLHSGPQHILLGWDIGGLGYPVQIVQIAEENDTNKETEKGETARELNKTVNLFNQ